jgi:hypothetical protein
LPEILVLKIYCFCRYDNSLSLLQGGYDGWNKHTETFPKPGWRFGDYILTISYCPEHQTAELSLPFPWYKVRLHVGYQAVGREKTVNCEHTIHNTPLSEN